MAESSTEKSGADVREASAESPAPDFRKWRKSGGMDGLKRRTLRAMKAAEEMLYSAETRTEAAESIKLLTQASNSHRRVLRDVHRAELELESTLTERQFWGFIQGVVTAFTETFEAHDVPRAAREELTERLAEVADQATAPQLEE